MSTRLLIKTGEKAFGILIGLIIFVFVCLSAFISLFVPSSSQDFIEIYKEVAEDFNINWIDMIALDMVRYDNNFKDVTQADVVNTALDFLKCDFAAYKWIEVEDDEDGGHWSFLADESYEGSKEIQDLLIYLGYRKYLKSSKNVLKAFKKMDTTMDIMSSKLYKFLNAAGESASNITDTDYKFDFDIVEVKDIYKLILTLEEEKQEWAYSIVDSNIIPILYDDSSGDDYVLPDHYTIKFSGFFAFPSPEVNIITSPFGWRIHPVTGKRKFHAGIDIAGANASVTKGKPVIASADGEVVLAKNSKTAGNYIVLSHIDDKHRKWQTKYMHLNRYIVRVGQTVKQGSVIGSIGNTGRSTGPHLHFEIRVDGQMVNPLDYVSNIGNEFIKN